MDEHRLDTFSTDFFVTYSGVDVEWSVWICATLESAGHSTVTQIWDFRPGGNFMTAMDHALEHSRHAIGVLSPAYLASMFTQAEWTAAYRQALLGKRRALIPVRVAECDPGPLLGPLSYIDLVGVSEREAQERLLVGVAETVPRPPVARFPGGLRA